MAHDLLSNVQNTRLAEIDQRLAALEDGRELGQAFQVATGGRRPKNGQIVKLPLTGAWGELPSLLQERAGLLVEDKIRSGQHCGF